MSDFRSRRPPRPPHAKRVVIRCTVGLAACVISMLAVGTTAQAQTGSQFGIQQRANAARDLIVLAVQQGISSLPPTSGQSFSYQFDPELGTWTFSSILGPTSLRSTQTVREGNLSVRAAFSYFDLSDSLGPVDYKVLSAITPDPPGYCTRFGLDIDSQVGLFNVATNYGITNRIEADLNIPVVVSHTHAFQTFASNDGGRSVAANYTCDDPQRFNVPIAKVSFADISLPGGQSVNFNDGTNAGVGRISVGAKALLYTSERLDISFSPEFYFPSPNEDQYAGSSSAAILPRVVLQGKVQPLRVHVDAGYEHDFEYSTLRRFTWNTGLSLPVSSPQSEFDLGVGGSVFNEGIQWSPDVAPILNRQGDKIGSIRALGNTELGSNFVDFLAGMKFRVGKSSVVSGAVNVPVNSEGFRAAAVGTIAFEYYVF